MESDARTGFTVDVDGVVANIHNRRIQGAATSMAQTRTIRPESCSSFSSSSNNTSLASSWSLFAILQDFLHTTPPSGPQLGMLNVLLQYLYARGKRDGRCAMGDHRHRCRYRVQVFGKCSCTTRLRTGTSYCKCGVDLLRCHNEDIKCSPALADA